MDFANIHQKSHPKDILISGPPISTAQQSTAKDGAKSPLSSLESGVTNPLASTSSNSPMVPGLTTSVVPSNGLVSPQLPYALSSSTTEILARMSAQPMSDYSVARDHVLKSITTSDNLPALPIPSGGRGRGRPRGTGRRATAGASTVAGAEMEIASTTAKTSPLTPMTQSETKRGGRTRGSGRGRGGRRVGKRKRADSNELSLSDSDAKQDDKDDDESDGAIELPKITKSGRAINRPSQFVPVLPSPTTASGKKKRKSKKNPENAVCNSCERGHSPNNNAIVFCDGCSTPYHQFCHTPPIGKEFIEDLDKEWHCVECNKKTGNVPFDLKNLVSGQKLSNEEKRAALSKLSHSELIDILIQTAKYHPILAIFPAQTLQTNGTASDEPPAELPYDGYETDPPAHYPAPGNGLARTLPPESEDLEWLLDDNTEVFNHVSNYGSASIDNKNRGHADMSANKT